MEDKKLSQKEIEKMVILTVLGIVVCNILLSRTKPNVSNHYYIIARRTRPIMRG